MGSARQVVSKLWDATRELEAPDSEVIEAGDFRLNVARKRATVCGRELQLTSEEFDVLLFLAGHPKRVITQRTMLTTNSSDHAGRQTEFLRVLFSLRAKLLEAGEGCKYLRTEPWVFYQFDPSASKH